MKLTHLIRRRCGRRAATAGRRGHTIVELLIVLALMAALAGIAMPRVNFMAMRLDGNLRIVRSVLQQAWRLSVQKQHDILVSFDTASRRMRILEDMNNDGLPTNGERVTWRSLEEGVQFGKPPAGVYGAVTGAVAGLGVRTVTSLPTVIFRRNGSTSGDVEIYLTALYHGTQDWRGLTVAQSTGRTDWYRRVNNVWRSGGM
jgi:prepilin-type N-terminal cleavage/methylation domain-containing protein